MTVTQQQLSHAHVLVVGDVMLDRYWYGAVDRISPEAPVPGVATPLIRRHLLRGR